jgi:hypothetical protein
MKHALGPSPLGPVCALTRAWCFAALAGCMLTSAAQAQLREEDVLVVYDSRIADSRAVAEYYAGSKRVPGGAGNIAGVRPGVRTLDLASTGAAVTSPGNISYPDFIANLRNPLRTYLTSNNLASRVRCLVLTKGLPHRLQDTDVPNNADFPGEGPGQFIPELISNDCTSASVDAELALLFQDLTLNEMGGSSDSRADGVIFNPYSRQRLSILAFNNQFSTNAKLYTNSGVGPLWQPAGTVGTATRLNPGDVYLTTRLDGNTVLSVQQMLDRTKSIRINTSTVAVLLDEDGANLDNVGATFPGLNAGNDYELTQTSLINDRRFSFTFPSPPPNVLYNNLAGVTSFYVGPNLAFTAGQGILVTQPVILLATYGSNHSGVPTLAAGGSAGTVYADSFNYANGAIFNTIESFNGRDFGGLGQLGFAPQQQASGFLAAGGSFAVCNVWEPLADSIPDNRYLVENFVLGNLSWAEAAWTSIPGLSWMQMAVGDPLSRITRSNEDITSNNLVNMTDVYAWENLPAGNAAKDVNRSGTADTADRDLVLASIRAGERGGLQTSR